ncbi:MAG: energy-coupling factor transporter ATPase [Firmicutes bacterium]|nr:energy-coupling factor transporter ATPase [Bacillota bacterium]
MASDPIIQLKNVSFAYEQGEEVAPEAAVKAVDGVSFDVERGSFVAIVGSNGSGKSTLAKHFNALLIPTEGEVLVDGMNTAEVAETAPWEIRQKVGMVFQNPDNQLVSSIVEDDVAFGPENIGIEPAEIRRRVDESLKLVGMYEHRKKGPHLLSGGQKQRIAIAGVIAMDPECVVFDEPTAMLDPKGRKEIMSIIRTLHSQGRTVILITHFMEEAAEADRIIIMHNGKVEADATPAEIFSRKDLGVLEQPFAVRLAKRLRESGIEVPADIVTDVQLAEYLCKLK